MIGGIAFGAPAVELFVPKAPIIKHYLNKGATHISVIASTASYLLPKDFVLLLCIGAFTCNWECCTMSKDRFSFPLSVRYTFSDLFNRRKLNA